MTATPRPSASLCLVRDGSQGVEVVMAQRTMSARFMPGVWVFPGGVVDEGDWSEAAAAALDGVDEPADQGWLAAAVRETVEEVGIWYSENPSLLGVADRPSPEAIYASAGSDREKFVVGGLAYFSNWVTPAHLPIRFDARFYLASLTADLDPIADTTEMNDARWIDVVSALQAADDGDFAIAFPTYKTLQLFANFPSTSVLVSWARSLQTVPETLPRIRVTGDELEIVLPWDEGYDDLPAIPSDDELLLKIRRARGVDGTRVPEMESRD